MRPVAAAEDPDCGALQFTTPRGNEGETPGDEVLVFAFILVFVAYIILLQAITIVSITSVVVEVQIKLHFLCSSLL